MLQSRWRVALGAVLCCSVAGGGVADAGSAKPVTREAHGVYIGNGAAHQANASYGDGEQLGLGRLLFEISAPKTDRYVTARAVDEYANAVPIQVRFTDSSGALIAGTVKDSCNSSPKLKVPPKAYRFGVIIRINDCGVTTPVKGDVWVTFTSR